MNRLTYGIVVGLILMLGLPAAAQPPDRPERFDRGYGPRQAHRPPGPADPDRAPVDQWLRLIDLQNPDEARRLRDLREEDPWAFRDVMQTKLFEERFHRILRDRHARLYAFILNESPEEQARILQSLRELADTPPRGPPSALRPEGPRGTAYPPHRPGPRGEGRHGGRPFLSPEAASAFEQIRAEPDADRRRELQESLRRQLEAERQQRAAERRQQLDQIEQRLMEVRALLNQQQQEQERLIDERMQDLMEEAE